jgi:hypothetical protein
MLFRQNFMSLGKMFMDVTVQVEKETYYFHLSGLGANWENFNDFGSSKFYDTSKSIKDI